MNDNSENDLLDAGESTQVNGFEVAVIGMAGRFPGAANVNEFWENLCNGVESIKTFTDDEVIASGMDPNLLHHPDFVPALGLLEGTEMFDAAFFEYSPREAKTMAPQHRVMLECAYEALQHAGYDAKRYDGPIGVFAGESSNLYTRPRQFENSSNKEQFYSMHASMGNDRDFLSTTVSYKLDLRGPSLTIQTACSTSLATVHMAYQSLLGGECDIALAGGIALRMPPKAGYIYEKEGILSPDGRCRAFDAAAQGTVGGEGVGMVTLKRLEDAHADGDYIHAVIKGSALNNDGSLKVGFTAPGIDGQADVIARAQAMGEIEPETIGYIETHGTGTALGDPIEIAALTKAFRARGADKNQYCPIGSLKTNIGHLDTAAGVAGLIKTVLVLRHRQIPASLHFTQANPQIDFDRSPFYVSQALTDYQPGNKPFRAGVSSFGIGGSNVHMVLEEPPRYRSGDNDQRPAKLLLLSARTETALEQSCENLVTHLQAHTDQALADVAFTLQVGRQQFQQRRMLVCDSINDALTALAARDPKRVFNGVGAEKTRPVVFMFPGQGSQHVDMGRELYDVEAGFREHFDECCNLLKPGLGIDLRDLLFPSEQEREQAIHQINQTSLTQPALFALEYSLAQLWISWGVRPQAMIGHSIGEYVAACLSGVLSLADALSLVTARAALMQSMAAGSMTAVSLPANEVEKILDDGISLAAINEPSMCVVSGPTESIAAMEARLETRGTDCRRLHTSHAFHSEMMNDVIQPFEDLLRGIEINSPQIPYISNLTGTWVTAQELTEPAYWSRHLRSTVLFAAGLEALFDNPHRIFLEVGPGQTLSSLVRSNPSRQSGQLVISSMRHPKNQLADSNALLNALGRLWLGGVEIDWNGYYRYQSPQRVPLPGYPFERQKHWIEPANDLTANKPSTVRQPLHNWFYAQGWKSMTTPWIQQSAQLSSGNWLVFADGGSLCQHFIDQLRRKDRQVTVVTPGNDFSSRAAGEYTLRPGQRADMAALLAELNKFGKLPRTIVHLWSGAATQATENAGSDLDRSLANCFYSLLHLAQILDEYPTQDSVELIVVGRGTQSVSGAEKMCPGNAPALGLCHVIQQEQDRIRCRSIDVEVAHDGSDQEPIAKRLLAEVGSSSKDPVVALRSSGRWTQVFEPVYLNEPRQPDAHLRQQGVYLITGGLGKIGLSLAHYLAQAVSARLVLIGRSQIPPKDTWDAQLAAQGEDSSVGRKIHALRALEQAGAEVLTLCADVADEAEMRQAIDQVSAQYGPINGVIHAVATDDAQSFQLLRDLDQEACELHFRPKIKGLQVLNQVLQGQNPDFCILMSSLASLLGGLRFAGYAAANAYQDAFAQSQSGVDGGLPWLSVNWDGWQFGAPEASTRSAVARLAMRPQEGVEAFARLLAVSAIPRLAVSTWDLQSRFEQWATSPQKSAADAVEPGDAAGGKQPAAGPAGSGISQAPRLETAQDIEKFLCEMWQELLGVDGITAGDNFFELGGDSLLALQVTSRLRQSLLADLSVASVLEAPNIAELTRRILEKQQSMSDGDQASDMLQRLKSLTPEEKQRYLAEARKGQNTGK